MALSQLNSTNELARQKLYAKLFDACRGYFADTLKDGADAKKLITAYVDARHIRGLHSTIADLGFIDLTPEEHKACREAALNDVLLEMKIKALVTQYDNYAKTTFAKLVAEVKTEAKVVEAELVPIVAETK